MKAQLQTLANRYSRNVPATALQLRAINMLLSTYCESREERLLLLGHLFDRPLTSSKELSKSEASAFIELAFDDHKHWTISARFIHFLTEQKAEMYAF